MPVLVGGALLAGPARCAPAEPRLEKGVISYTIGGERHVIDVGRACADLWVAPDESVIAFIAIDRFDETEKDPNGEGLPLILESSVYVARKAEGFAPLQIFRGATRLDGQSWSVYRYPRVPPDGRSVLFSVPTSITSGTLLSHEVATGLNEVGGLVVSYCVEWGGRSAGVVLLQRRYISDSVVKHRCYVWFTRDSSDARVVGDCEDFDEFAGAWSRGDGGACR
jgi:hypothetical protein